MNENDLYKSWVVLGVRFDRPVDGEHNHQRQNPEAPEAEIYRTIAEAIEDERAGELIGAIAEKLGELIGAMADFTAAFLNSDAFAELCAQIANYQPPTTPRPPKAIDPTVDAPMRHIMPRARSQLRCTKRR